MLAAADRDPTVLRYVRKFPDGTWLAVVAHDFHRETRTAEWNGAALRDSRGGVYWTDHHFCGEEGLTAEVRDVPARTLPEFHRNATRLELRPDAPEGIQ